MASVPAACPLGFKPTNSSPHLQHRIAIFAWIFEVVAFKITYEVEPISIKKASKMHSICETVLYNLRLSEPAPDL